MGGRGRDACTGYAPTQKVRTVRDPAALTQKVRQRLLIEEGSQSFTMEESGDFFVRDIEIL